MKVKKDTVPQKKINLKKVKKRETSKLKAGANFEKAVKNVQQIFKVRYNLHKLFVLKIIYCFHLFSITYFVFIKLYYYIVYVYYICIDLSLLLNYKLLYLIKQLSQLSAITIITRIKYFIKILI